MVTITTEDFSSQMRGFLFMFESKLFKWENLSEVGRFKAHMEG
jgi:hypothetical protein